MRWLTADLHIHTVLSACAEAEMLPPLIVSRALALGLDTVAITDHNSAENAAAVISAAAGTGLVVLPGMELQTREEVHLLALFDACEAALALQEIVYAALPPQKNRPEHFGEQIVVDAAGDFVQLNDRLLQASTTLSLEAALAVIKELGGISVAAHVDRPMYSIIANLGFVPPALPLDGVSLSAQVEPQAFLADHPDLQKYQAAIFSDAHTLAQMLAGTEFFVETANTSELALAFRGFTGRGLRLLGR